MLYDEFLKNIEMLALKHGLFLHMHRADVGSGFIFYFRVPETKRYSNTLVFKYERNSPEELFKKLDELAIEFKIAEFKGETHE